MKIGIVCYPTFGGSGVVATELGIELSNKGHEVHFITYSQPVRLEALTSNLYFHEGTVPEYPLFKYEPYELALSSKLYDVISKHKLDLLHVHYAIPHAYAGYMAKQILKDNGLIISGTNKELNLVEIIELKNHPWFVGVQFHPELKSRVLNPNPLFKDFIAASIDYHEKK